MRLNRFSLKFFALATALLAGWILKAPAQTAPGITNQPASQTVPPGTNVVLTVGVSGTAPFSYQWQFNGTNFPNNLIGTVVGTGSSTYAGDGGLATNASLRFPWRVALDTMGNLYLADSGNNRIRKVDTNGIITTVAGNGTNGFAGDNGAATSAKMSNPRGLALDSIGNLFIADTGNSRIRKVDTNGIITTVAGSGNIGIYGDNGYATNASLYAPSAVTIDATGNVFIADTGNGRMRKVNTNGIISTIAGNYNATYYGDNGYATNAGLNSPLGVTLDTAGDLFIADSGNNRIRKVDTNGIITTVAGKGTAGFSGDGKTATNATLNGPYDVVVNPVGDLFIADTTNARIRKVDFNGIITTVAGNGTLAFSGDGGLATAAGMNIPCGVTLDASGNLLITDYYECRIRKITLFAGQSTFSIPSAGAINTGNYTVVITNKYGSITSQAATLTVTAPPAIVSQPASQLALAGSNPQFSVAAVGTVPFGCSWFFDGTNQLQSGTNTTLALSGITTNDAGAYTAVITNVYGSITSQVATLTVTLPPAILAPPMSQTVAAGGSASFTVTPGGTGPFSYQWSFDGTSFTNNIIRTVAGIGTNTYSGAGVPATNAALYYPEGLVFDTAGNLYIADHYNSRIRKVDTNGIITTFAGNGGNGFSGDGGAATNATLYYPSTLAFDAGGNLYICDQYNCRIRKVATNGIITTIAGNGTYGYSGDGSAATAAELGLPYGIAIDPGGNLLISDSDNNRVRRVSLGGIITTFAGNGTQNYAGNGIAATNAELSNPLGLAFDTAANLYIADSYNGRVRKVATNGIITTVAGTNSSSESGDGGAATNASFGMPFSLALDTTGDIFVSDYFGGRIREIFTNGIIVTAAGNTNGTFSGDGGPATNAILNTPTGLAFDAAGNLWLADHGNQRIREINYAGQPALTLTNVSPANAGNYLVTITSIYGSITSSVATLTVTVSTNPPQIYPGGTSFGFTTNQPGFGFNFSGVAGQTIVIDASTDLTTWTPLFTNSATGTNAVSFSDPVSSNFPARYYRARLP